MKIFCLFFLEIVEGERTSLLRIMAGKEFFGHRLTRIYNNLQQIQNLQQTGIRMKRVFKLIARKINK